MDDRGSDGKFNVAIIGAGFGGLTIGHELLKRLNLQTFVIYEKSPRSAGGAGTWRDNTYPGCACDVPIALYAPSWAQDYNWSEYLPLQSEIQNYLNNLTHRYGLYRHIQFATEVKKCVWDRKAQEWVVTLRSTAPGAPLDTYEVRHKIVVFSAGPLSQPVIPKGINAEVFEGEQFHTFDYRHDVHLEGKRVAVVGNGCSAVQAVPIIAKRCKKLYQFVSTPQYLNPRDNPRYTEFQQWSFRNIPGRRFYERYSVLQTYEQMHYMIQPGRKNVEARKKYEQDLIDYMKKTAPAKYHDQLTPKYPLGYKRLAFDSNWFKCLHRENVEALFTRVVKVGENSIICADGTEIAVDVIIWATGFNAREPFQSVEIYGEDQPQELHQRWREEGQASAYLGAMCWGLPNFCEAKSASTYDLGNGLLTTPPHDSTDMTTGPNTGSVHIATTIVIDWQARFIGEIVKEQVKNDVESFSVSQRAHREYNEEIQARISTLTWAADAGRTWFKDPVTGKIATLWPGSSYEMMRRLYWPRFSDFHQVGGRKVVKGTTWTREITKYLTFSVSIISLLYLGTTRRSLATSWVQTMIDARAV